MKKMMTWLLLSVTTIFSCSSGTRGARQELSYRDPSSLETLIASGGTPYHLVDVRTPEEFEDGHIPTAVNIPYDRIARNLPTQDKDALVIVYCRSGNRSGIAERSLKSLGFTNVVDFGAVSRWRGRLQTADAVR